MPENDADMADRIRSRITIDRCNNDDVRAIIRHEQDSSGVARQIAIEAAAICNVRLDDKVSWRADETLTFGEALQAMAEELIRKGRDHEAL